jgi:hypothetical protein
MDQRLPNDVMLTEADRKRLLRLLDVAKATPECEECRKTPWCISGAEFLSREDVVRYYVNPNASRDVWPARLATMIDEAPEVAVISLQDSCRDGLEHLPPHVTGWQYTFFVDPVREQVLLVVKGMYSV